MAIMDDKSGDRRLIPCTDPDRGVLPYGFWTLENGGMVLFNRNYMPLYQWDKKTRLVTSADRKARIEWKGQHWFRLDDLQPYRWNAKADYDKETHLICGDLLARWAGAAFDGVPVTGATLVPKAYIIEHREDGSSWRGKRMFRAPNLHRAKKMKETT